jgi:hypothetical protein
VGLLYNKSVQSDPAPLDFSFLDILDFRDSQLFKNPTNKEKKVYIESCVFNKWLIMKPLISLNCLTYKVSIFIGRVNPIVSFEK